MIFCPNSTLLAAALSLALPVNADPPATSTATAQICLFYPIFPDRQTAAAAVVSLYFPTSDGRRLGIR
ncbi:hypothetical protein [Microcoleus sp. T3B2]|uniref:hypothetical protein n=1 Tax=Microcoleus sp. T3B2 TaxID=3055426 RepID=UPI002FD33061